MRNRGFSLIELMIVVAIIGILVAVALPQFASMSDDAKIAKAKQDIDVIVGALTRYNAMEPRKAEKLNDLKGKYMVKLPVDPWGADYFLDKSSGIIGSSGTDGKKASRDDITISYLPDPILMDVKFLDVGTPRVCLPGPDSTLNYSDEYRMGKYSAPNDRRAGPGDMIELTFARPIWYNGLFTAVDEQKLDHTVNTDEKIRVESGGAIDADDLATDIIFLNAPVAPDDADEIALAKVGDGASLSASTEYPAMGYIPWAEPDKFIIIIGDVTKTTTAGDPPLPPMIIPGSMYMNLQMPPLNKFNDRSSDQIPCQPASRPIQLRL